jgi:hypothetical protein
VRLKPEEYFAYFEDLKRGTNKDLGPKDIFEIAFKDNQEGGINQCFYFDKTSNKRLYIATTNDLKKAHL